MKKKFLLVLIISLLGLLALSLFACDRSKNIYIPNNIVFDGDVAGALQFVDLKTVTTTEIEYEVDAQIFALVGWDLDEILLKVRPTYATNFLLLTRADGAIAEIEAKRTAKVFIYENEKGFCVIAPTFPDFVQIEGLREITVMKQGNASTDFGVRIVKPTIIASADLYNDTTTVVSFGRSKLQLYSTDGKDYGTMIGSKVRKHTLKPIATTVGDFAKSTQCIAYFDDFDIVKNASNIGLAWENGRIKCQVSKDTQKTLFGIAVGTDSLNFDIFEDMSESLKKGEKLMVVLLDGLSWQQVNKYKDKLTLLKPEDTDIDGVTKKTIVAATTNIPKSEVALAAILTGKSPFVNGVTSNKIQKMNVADIFSVATKYGISTKYIEGNAKMLDTSVEAELTFADKNGFTDKDVKDVTEKAISDGNNFIFTHFHGIDDQNHKSGPISEKAIEKILEVEGYVKELMTMFDGKVILVSDHGQYNYKDNGVMVGGHGAFNGLDMFVPVYTISNGKSWS